MVIFRTKLVVRSGCIADWYLDYELRVLPWGAALYSTLVKKPKRAQYPPDSRVIHQLSCIPVTTALSWVLYSSCFVGAAEETPPCASIFIPCF